MKPVMIVCGEIRVDTPSFGQKKINHITENMTAWVNIISGILSKGTARSNPCTLLLIVQILRSITGTCSPGPQVFRITPLTRRASWITADSSQIDMCWPQKPSVYTSWRPLTCSSPKSFVPWFSSVLQLWTGCTITTLSGLFQVVFPWIDPRSFQKYFLWQECLEWW